MIYIYTQMAFFWWIKMAWKISLEVQRLATFTLWIRVFTTTVSFAPLSFDTQKFCIPSKLWPHGRTVEWWSKRTGPRCVGKQVAKCSGVSIWSHTSQKNHKKKKKKCYHFMWESLHMYSSACRTVYPFILAHFFWANTSRRARNGLKFGLRCSLGWIE